MTSSSALADDTREVTMDDEEEDNGYWCYLAEAALLQVFGYLDHKDLMNVGLVCKTWNATSYDDLLWRDIFHRDFKTDVTVYPSKRMVYK